MKKFRQKQFTIQEGHYTGPKDMDKVPGVMEMIGKSALAGAGLGGIVGGLVKDSSITEGAITGGKYGTLVGLALKFLLNYLHNPMKTVKFQEVDKLIRREFGIYRVSGITVGDSIEKRGKVEDKFSFNDREVTKYVLNFSIQENQVTMYTFGMTDKELKDTSDTLDYYCKKYFGMEYSSHLINQKVNSYSVHITFTNYQVIANFIMELSNKLGKKINLLDNKAILESRIVKASEEGSDEKRFSSVPSISKYDLFKILGGSGLTALLGLKAGWGESLSVMAIDAITRTIDTLSDAEYSKIFPFEQGTMKRSQLGNKYLESTLRKLRYVEGFHYSVGEKGCSANMSLTGGVFVVTVSKDSSDYKNLEEVLGKDLKSKVRRSENGKVVIYTYLINSKNEFEFILKKLMSVKPEINLFI